MTAAPAITRPSRYRPGTPTLDDELLAAVLDGVVLGEKVWLEVPRYGSATQSPGGIQMVGRTLDASETVDRVGVVLAVGNRVPVDIRVGQSAHFHRYYELPPADPAFHRINDELRALRRERGELPEVGEDDYTPEDGQRRQEIKARMVWLEDRRPPHRQFVGENFRTRDGRSLIALPWQCIVAVVGDDPDDSGDDER